MISRPRPTHLKLIATTTGFTEADSFCIKQVPCAEQYDLCLIKDEYNIIWL